MLFEENKSLDKDQYPWAQDFIDAIWGGFWTANKFSFDSDYADFKTRFDAPMQERVVRLIASIVQVEVRVKKFWHDLGLHFPHESIHNLGAMLSANEVIHGHAYRKLLTRLGLKSRIDEMLQHPALAGRVGYLTKHLEKNYGDDRKQYVYSLVLFTLFVENVSLFSQFYSLLWMDRNMKVLRDTAQQVKYTRNEELLHGQVGTALINTLRVEYPELFDAQLEAKIVEECGEAYRAECALIDWMIGDFAEVKDGEGLSAPVLKNYVAERLNESLVGIGYAPQFRLDPALTVQTGWMKLDLLSNPRVDKFHVHPTSYTKAARPFDDGDLF